MPRGRQPGMEGDGPGGIAFLRAGFTSRGACGCAEVFSRDKNVAGPFDLFLAQINGGFS